MGVHVHTHTHTPPKAVESEEIEIPVHPVQIQGILSLLFFLSPKL